MAGRTPQHQCPSCAKLLTTSSSLNRHILRTHSGILPSLKCTEHGCFRAFFSRQDWERHVDQHAGNASHKHPCPNCGKSFSRVSSLNRHKLKTRGSCRRTSTGAAMEMAHSTDHLIGRIYDDTEAITGLGETIASRHDILPKSRPWRDITFAEANAFMQHLQAQRDFPTPQVCKKRLRSLQDNDKPLESAQCEKGSLHSDFVSQQQGIQGRAASDLSIVPEDTTAIVSQLQNNESQHDRMASLLYDAAMRVGDLPARTEISSSKSNHGLTAVRTASSPEPLVDNAKVDMADLVSGRLSSCATSSLTPVTVNEEQAQAVGAMVMPKDTETARDDCWATRRLPRATWTDWSTIKSVSDLKRAWVSAIHGSHVEGVDVLGSLESVLNSRDGASLLWRTALHIAANNADTGLLRCLLSKPRVDVDVVALELCDFGYTDTPLTLAMRKLKLEAVACLLEAGADIHVPVMQAGHPTTPLRMSMKPGACLDMARSMLRHVKKQNLGLLGTPLMHLTDAVGCTETLSLLLEFGADVHARDDRRRTALHVACANGHFEATEILLQYHADVNASDIYGKTPLHEYGFANNDSTDILELLIDSGAEVNASYISGHTALHSACVCMKLNHINFLLLHGADARVKSGTAETPFHYLVANYSTTQRLEPLRSIIQDLVYHGADINARDAAYRTPLMCASHGLVHYPTDGGPSVLCANQIHTLAEEGASLNLVDCDRKTVLDHILESMVSPRYRKWCSEEPSFFPDLIKYLLEKGAMSGKQVAAGQDSDDANPCDTDSESDDSSVTAQCSH